MKEDILDIVNEVRKKSGEAKYKSDEEYFVAAEQKLSSIMKNAGTSKNRDMIQRYISKSEVNRRRVLILCEKLNDHDNIFGNDDQCDGCFVSGRRHGYKNSIMLAGPGPKGFVNKDRSRFLEDYEVDRLRTYIDRKAPKDNFQNTYHRIRKEHGMTPVEVMENSHLAKQTFYNAIKSGKMTKHVACLIALGLHCSVEEAEELLFCAGHPLGGTQFDLVVKYFFETNNYNPICINDALDALGVSELFNNIYEPEEEIKR